MKASDWPYSKHIEHENKRVAKIKQRMTEPVTNVTTTQRIISLSNAAKLNPDTGCPEAWKLLELGFRKSKAMAELLERARSIIQHDWDRHIWLEDFERFQGG